MRPVRGSRSQPTQGAILLGAPSPAIQVRYPLDTLAEAGLYANRNGDSLLDVEDIFVSPPRRRSFPYIRVTMEVHDEQGLKLTQQFPSYATVDHSSQVTVVSDHPPHAAPGCQDLLLANSHELQI